MTLNTEDKRIIVELRLLKAEEAIVEAQDNLKMKHYRVSVNRLYYACYYAASALLINNNITTHTHSGVINQLGLHFVSKKIISMEQENFSKNYLNSDKQVIMMIGLLLKKMM
ncbi:MAG: HEPN domain-containing protein [Bacteroidales bacterium]|jgi:uncharacterized protein (UPF0332 family)|nr:HEPN domain-containing protein [Bacteroidales bacterium]